MPVDSYLASTEIYFVKVWKLISQPLFQLGGNDISIVSLLAAVLILLCSIKLSRTIEKIVFRALKSRDIDSGLKSSVARFSRYLVLLLGVFITLDTMGISLSSLAALGAVLMVGVGFGLQNITQNFIAGLILLIERPIKKGDLVRVGETAGRIIDIQARSTVVQTRDDISIIVPNSQFISEQVVNESFSGDKVRLHVGVGVAYGSDVELVKSVLLKVAREHQQVLQYPESNVVFRDFGDSSLDFELRVWVEELWANDIILSDLRFAIDREFRENKVVIPFPQRDVHIYRQGGETSL